MTLVDESIKFSPLSSATVTLKTYAGNVNFDTHLLWKENNDPKIIWESSVNINKEKSSLQKLSST